MAGLTSGFETTSKFEYAVFDADQKATQHSDLATTSHASEPAITFALVCDLDGFEALEAEWGALFERAGRADQVFQTFAWNWHWAQTFLDADQTGGRRCPIAILTGHRDGQLVTVWPLVLQRRNGMRELAWMGEPVSQYGDILVDPVVANHATLLLDGWTYLCRQLRPDLARLRKVRTSATIAPLLAFLGSMHTAVLEAPFIDLTRMKSFAAYEERFSTRSRRNRRRQMRRLEEAGPVTFKHLDQGAEAEALAGVAIEIKRRWLIDRGHVSPALADTRMARFMQSVAGSSCHRNGTRVSVLLSGTTPAAVQIGFTAKNTRTMHVIAYDRAYEKMAAGALHLEEAIRHALTEGLDRIDLLAPKADYKKEWADGAVGVVDHAIGLTIIGRLYARLYLGYVRERLKEAVEHLPQSARQMLVKSHLRAAARRILALFGLG